MKNTNEDFAKQVLTPLTPKDFPDLENNFYLISKEHFDKGLDINTTFENEEYFRVSGKPNVVFKIQPTPATLWLFRKHFFSPDMDTYEFAKNSLPKINKNYYLPIAFYALENQNDTDLIEYMIDQKLIDINEQYQGYTLLMGTNKRKQIENLIKLGADSSIQGLEPTSVTYGKTAYDMALKTKNKNWISYLKPYVSEDVLGSASEERLKLFKVSDVKKQLNLYCNSVKEQDHTLTDEIVAHQDIYQPLITYRDSLKKNLINYAISHQVLDILEKILTIEYYQQNRDTLNTTNHHFSRYCYTTEAIEIQKKEAAEMLYLHNFKNDECLKNYIGNKFYYPVPEVLKHMIDDGYKPSLDVRMQNLCSYQIEKETYSKKQIDKYFDKHPYMLNMGDMYHEGKCLIRYNNSYVFTLKTEHIKILSWVMVQQKIVDKTSFDNHFKIILGGLGQNPKSVGLRLGNIFIKNFPEENLLDWLGAYSKRDWLIKINKDNLQAELDKFEYAPQVKKMKI